MKPLWVIGGVVCWGGSGGRAVVSGWWARFDGRRWRWCDGVRFGEPGRSRVVEADEVVAFVLVEAVLPEEFEGFVPDAAHAEVEHAGAEVVGNVGQIIFGHCFHNLFMIYGLRLSVLRFWFRRVHANIFGFMVAGRVGHLRGDPQKR